MADLAPGTSPQASREDREAGSATRRLTAPLPSIDTVSALAETALCHVSPELLQLMAAFDCTFGPLANSLARNPGIETFAACAMGLDAVARAHELVLDAL